jgi:hypothetical protein
MLLTRANNEYCLAEATDEKQAEAVRAGYADLAAKMQSWTERTGMGEALSSREQALRDKPFGTWTEQEIIGAGWREEALLVIEWALGIVDYMPPYDQQADASDLIERLLSKPMDETLSGAALRPPEIIIRARNTAELWLWRARTTTLQQDPEKYPPPASFTYERIIAVTAEHSEKDGLFTTIGGDFPAFGKPYSQLSDDEWSIMRSIATERLHGLNWLCGYSTDWDEVRTDT